MTSSGRLRTEHREGLKSARSGHCGRLHKLPCSGYSFMGMVVALVNGQAVYHLR